MKYFSIAFAHVMAILVFSMVSFVATASHNSPESLEARVAAVGTLNIASGNAATSIATNQADDATVDGEAIYSTTCATCHASGVAGAPVLGEVADWEDRIEQGLNSLVQNALLGFTGSSGVMPPKGGNTTLSDKAVTAAVQYMVDQVE